jgi:hypothetical protein
MPSSSLSTAVWGAKILIPMGSALVSLDENDRIHVYIIEEFCCLDLYKFCSLYLASSIRQYLAVVLLGYCGLWCINRNILIIVKGVICCMMFIFIILFCDYLFLIFTHMFHLLPVQKCTYSNCECDLTPFSDGILHTLNICTIRCITLYLLSSTETVDFGLYVCGPIWSWCF